MPLVVPGLTSNSNDSSDLTSQWMNQLMGKKIGDASNETVWTSRPSSTHRIPPSLELVQANTPSRLSPKATSPRSTA